MVADLPRLFLARHGDTASTDSRQHTGRTRAFFCRPASVGVLGFEQDRRDEPIIRLWNYVSEPRE